MISHQHDNHINVIKSRPGNSRCDGHYLPAAYEDIDAVMATQTDMVDVVDDAVAVRNLKDTDRADASDPRTLPIHLTSMRGDGRT